MRREKYLAGTRSTVCF